MILDGRFQAIIFDMDGLLVDSETVWEEAENEVLLMHGVVPEPAVRNELVGLRNDIFLARMRDHYGIQATVSQLHDEVISRMLVLIPRMVKPQPGAREILRYVAETGIPTAIASNSPAVIIEATVASQGWSDLLRTRCSADLVPHGKPAPDVYLKAAEMLGVNPGACLALEDSANGARAAVAAGMTTFAVPDFSHTTAEAFAEVTPHIFDSLHTVLTYLRGA